MPFDVSATPILKGFSQPESDFGLSESQTIFPVSEMTLGAFEADETLVAASRTHKAILNSATNQMVGVVSSNYQPLTNLDFFNTIEETLRIAIGEEMTKGVQVRDRISGGGSWCQREYVFPEFSEVLKGTKLETRMGLRIIASNSYDGSASASLMTGLIDFYCTNGMIVGREVAREARRHTTRLTPQHFLPGLRTNLANIASEIEAVRHMQTIPLDYDKVMHFLENNLSGQRAAEMLARTKIEAEERGENVFALHSALSYYASHSDENFQVRNNDEAREARMLRGREDEVARLLGTQEWKDLVAA